MLILFSFGLFGFWLGILGLLHNVRDRAAVRTNSKAKLPPLQSHEGPALRSRGRRPSSREVTRAFRDLWDEILRGA